ncbi:MAG: tyrosine-protein phosphatase [Oscillospiraceae bacterium]
MGSLLETTMNTRDLGGYICDGGVTTQKEVIFRSDKQNYPSEKDIRYLLQCNITTIIDMRGNDDVLQSPSGFVGREGFLYHHIPIDEGSQVPESVEAVPGSYMEIAGSANMQRVFRTISEAPFGVMINCSAGKDRTGVVSAILLMLCGVGSEDIVFDYMKTKECNKERFAFYHKLLPEVDMNIVIPREEFMYEFLRLFKDKWQEPRNYLRQLGLSDSEIDSIIAKMVTKKR